MPSPMLRVYERAAGWMAEIWAVSEDGEGVREEALLESYGPYQRCLEAWLRAGESLRRALAKVEGGR